MAKKVKVTADNVFASPDGIRVVKYSKGFVFELPDLVADLLLKNKQAEESNEEATNSQPIPAVENVATPGETVTGGGVGDARDPAVLGNAVEFVTGANSTRRRVAPLDAPMGDGPTRERLDTDITSSPPAQRVTSDTVAPTDKPVPLSDTQQKETTADQTTTTSLTPKTGAPRTAAVKPPAQ